MTFRRLIASCMVAPALLLAMAADAQEPASFYPAERNWDRPTGGSVNVSGYAFRDINRNGIYDLGDQAMSGVVYLLDGPDGRRSRSSTNRAGFSNYRMSLGREDGIFRQPGRYRMVAIPPPGYKVSTGNAEQVMTVHELPGSPADLYVEPFPEPVGFVPILTVRGSATTPLEVSLRPYDADVARAIAVDGNGDFSAEVDAGVLTLVQTSDDGAARLERRIEVDRVPVHVSRIEDVARQAALLEARAAGDVITLDFDDLITGTEVRKIPNGYRGLRWSGLNAMHNKFSSADGYRNATMSGHYIVYGSSGHPGKVAKMDAPFDLVGVYLTSGRNQASGEVLHISGYADGELVYRDSVTLSVFGPVYFAADYLQVDEVHFVTNRYWQFAMDNLKIRH